MGKIGKVIGIMIAFFIMFSFPLSALTQEDFNELTNSQWEELGADRLDEKIDRKTKSLLEQMGTGELTPESVDVDGNGILKTIANLISENWNAPLTAAMSIIAVLVIGSYLSNMQSGLRKGTGTLFDIIGTLTVASILLVPLVPVVRNLTQSISNCSVFMISFIPVFTSAAAATGMPVTATAHSVISLACAEFISAFASQTLMPFVGIFLGFCVISGVAAFDFSLENVAAFIKKMVSFFLTASVTLYSGFLGVKSFVTSSGDTVAFKSAKFLLGAFVPVVGGAFGDAISSVQGSLNLIKNSIGVFGILAIFAYFLPHLVILFLWKVSIMACNSTAMILGQKKLSGLLSSAGDAVNILLAITIAVMLLFIITTGVLLVMGGNA